MLILIAVLIIIAALAVVAYPLFARRPVAPVASNAAAEQLEELLARREVAFQALRDLTFDHRVGKITDEDFAVFQANLKEVAAAALADLDRWEAEADTGLDAALERAIVARGAAMVEAGRTCPTCGKPATEDDRFCAGCGAPVPTEAPVVSAEPAGATCRRCGQLVAAEDRFCASCGGALAQPLR